MGAYRGVGACPGHYSRQLIIKLKKSLKFYPFALINNFQCHFNNSLLQVHHVQTTFPLSGQFHLSGRLEISSDQRGSDNRGSTVRTHTWIGNRHIIIQRNPCSFRITICVTRELMVAAAANTQSKKSLGP